MTQEQDGFITVYPQLPSSKQQTLFADDEIPAILVPRHAASLQAIVTSCAVCEMPLRLEQVRIEIDGEHLCSDPACRFAYRARMSIEKERDMV